MLFDIGRRDNVNKEIGNVIVVIVNACLDFLNQKGIELNCCSDLSSRGYHGR